jgi:uroporphyrinogen decarboxylase
MRYGAVDRIPYFEEPLRAPVIEAWNRQGLPPGANPAALFELDRYEVLEPSLEPLPAPDMWPATMDEIPTFRRLLDPDDPSRLPADWQERARDLLRREHVVMLEAHDGLFLSLGVGGWDGFERAVWLLADAPRVVRSVMEEKGQFAADLAARILERTDIDAAIFSEPISDNHGPLISPRMYKELVLPSYRPLFEVLQRHRVDTLIFRTFANSRLLLPCLLDHGFNCLWACEVNTRSMDYREIRREFGRDLRLIGGINLDALRRGSDEIRSEILAKVPPLLRDGGYIPLADGRIREDVRYEDYLCYRRLLTEICARA